MKKIFIGLGGLGCRIVTCRTNSRASEDTYFMLLDSDISGIKDYSNKIERDPILRNNVFIFNLANNVGRIISSFSMKQVGDYFGGKTHPFADISVNAYAGTHGIRVFGRILYDYFSEREEFKKIIRSIVKKSDNITLIIVSSLCGGFGSGIILPLAAKMKSMILDLGVQENSIDINVVGITSEIFDPIFPDSLLEYAQANTYATVKELNDIMSMPKWTHKITISEIYDSRKSQRKHINQFLVIEPSSITPMSSMIQNIASLLEQEPKDYWQYIEKNRLRPVDVTSNNKYKDSYYTIKTPLHIDAAWEKEKNIIVYEDLSPVTVFLSYCNTDSNLADIIDNNIAEYQNIKVSRYTRDVGYKGSFKEFMKSLRKSDYVIALISDNYLKSKACMYEVGELIKDENYKNKIIFIVIGPDDEKYYQSHTTKSNTAKIYDPLGVIEYIKYWENNYAELNDKIKLIESESAKIGLLQELKEIKKIIDQDLGPFLQYLSDARGRTFHEMYQSNFIDILKELGLKV